MSRTIELLEAARDHLEDLRLQEAAQTDIARLQRLADMGDEDAALTLRRMQVRVGTRPHDPVKDRDIAAAFRRTARAMPYFNVEASIVDDRDGRVHTLDVHNSLYFHAAYGPDDVDDEGNIRQISFNWLFEPPLFPGFSHRPQQFMGMFTRQDFDKIIDDVTSQHGYEDYEIPTKVVPGTRRNLNMELKTFRDVLDQFRESDQPQLEPARRTTRSGLIPMKGGDEVIRGIMREIVSNMGRYVYMRTIRADKRPGIEVLGYGRVLAKRLPKAVQVRIQPFGPEADLGRMRRRHQRRMRRHQRRPDPTVRDVRRMVRGLKYPTFEVLVRPPTARHLYYTLEEAVSDLANIEW